MLSHFYYNDIAFDVDLLYESYLYIRQKCPPPEAASQIALQHLPNTVENKHLDGIGSLWYNDGSVTSDAQFNVWNKEIENTYIIECLKSLPFPVVRTRIMIQQPKSCYSIHKDKTIRMHIPIYGAYDSYGKGGRFIFTEPAEILSFEEGKVILVNTTTEHTAINCSTEKERVHIVTCLPERSESDNTELRKIYDRFEY